MILVKENVYSVNQTFNTALSCFLDDIKADQPEMMLGILVPSNDELQKSCKYQNAMQYKINYVVFLKNFLKLHIS